MKREADNDEPERAVSQRKIASRAGGLLGAVLLSGCFTYVPVDRASVAPGQDVRVFVSRTGLAQLPEALASDRWVRGSLDAWDSGQLRLQVPIRRSVDGYLGADIREALEIPVGDVLEVERREFSRGRTAAMVAVGAAVATAGILVITREDRAPDDDGGPDPELIRLPLISVPWGR